jgi:hypothetical protein
MNGSTSSLKFFDPYLTEIGHRQPRIYLILMEVNIFFLRPLVLMKGVESYASIFPGFFA